MLRQGLGMLSGWLRRMASNERSMEEFQAVHNMILEVLRHEKVLFYPWCILQDYRVRTEQTP